MASGKKIDVAFLSVSTESSTDTLIKKIKLENNNLRCTFVKLTQQDLQSFEPRDTYDAVVLLHSISQGRNSITDVADAKYSKLLPQLKRRYGHDRVAVVVHSMTSFNESTKMALMMVFKKSQPTTFQCSKCIIQCNNPAEMPDQELTRLIEFLGNAPDHPLPVAEIQVPTPPTPAPSTDKTNKTTEDKSKCYMLSESATKGKQSVSTSGMKSSEIGSTSKKETEHRTADSSSSSDDGSLVHPLGAGSGSGVAPAKSSDSQTLVTCPSSTSSGGNSPQKMLSGTSQTGVSSSDTRKNSQAPLEADPLKNPSAGRYITEQKVIDTTFPIALVGLPSSNKLEILKDDLQQQLPGKTIIPMQGASQLKDNWHLFETILVDCGTLEAKSYRKDELEQAFSICQGKMVAPENLALLMAAPASSSSAHKLASDTIGWLVEKYRVHIFNYNSESGKQSLFDDDTKKRLISWLRECCERYHRAAAQKGQGFFSACKKAANVLSKPFRALWNMKLRDDGGSGVDA